MSQRVFTQTFGVVAVIIERKGKFLLIKEALKNSDKGKWNHPAGWIDVGEDPVKAGEREAMEESGFRFTATAILGVYSLVREDIYKAEGHRPHALKIVFVGNISEHQEAKLAEDSSEIGWFTAEEIENMPSDMLRDVDIKLMVKDYLGGKRYSLALLTHSVQN